MNELKDCIFIFDYLFSRLFYVFEQQILKLANLCVGKKERNNSF